jgi:Zn-dependent M28 family amino/carboxypeptidase
MRDSTAVDSARTAIARAQLREITRVLEAFGPLDVGADGGQADTGPLMRAGVPAVSHRTTMERYFHWHHTDADTFDKIDPRDLRVNTAAMAVLVFLLADVERRLGEE